MSGELPRFEPSNLFLKKIKRVAGKERWNLQVVISEQKMAAAFGFADLSEPLGKGSKKWNYQRKKRVNGRSTEGVRYFLD